MQLILVIIILAIAIIYAAYRIYKALTNHNDGCANCPLSDACKKNKKTNCK